MRFASAPFALLQPPSLCSGGSTLLQGFHFAAGISIRYRVPICFCPLRFAPAPFALLRGFHFAAGVSLRYRVPLRFKKKRTETNKNKRQPSSSALSSERPSSTSLSCLIKVLLCAPPSMWSVRSRLPRRSIASLTTARCAEP
jgi:hypothetical protein